MTRARPIVGGTADTAHPAVVAIVEHRPLCTSAEQVRCSGTLIAPRVVLTAAHCLEGLRGDELEVGFGADLRVGPATFIAVEAATIHPDYAPGLQVAGHDLALLLLAEPAPAAIVPIAIATTPPAELMVGATAQLVAFGAPADHTDGGLRLAADATIADVTATELTTAAGGVPCGADSGGAVLLATVDGERLVAAIKASGVGCTPPGLATALADEHAAFIAPFVAAAATAPPSTRPSIADFDSCAITCATVDDCPLGMLCLPDGEIARCGYRTLRTVDVGAACTAGADCVVIGQGADRACRLVTACPPDPVAPGGCGCGAAPMADSALPTAIGIGLLWRVARRRFAR